MRHLTRAELRHMREDQLGFYQELARQYGGVAAFRVLWLRFMLVTEPTVIRELLIKHGHQLHRDPFTTNVFRRFMGDSVFVAEDDAWKRQRKLVAPAFHASRIHAYADIMAQYAREMVLSWQPAEIRAVDQDLTQLTLRIIARTMYDVDLDAKTAEIGRKMKALLSVAEEQLKLAFLPPLWLPTRLNRQHKKAYREISALLLEIIRQRRAGGDDRGDLLSMLLSVTDEAGRPMPEKLVLDECLTLFVAGHETTAAALTWTWYLLGQHPAVAAQLKAEVDTNLGRAPITFADVAQLPFLNAVIKESMRLYPPAHGFGRAVQASFAIGEHVFAKGTTILVNTFVTHRRPALYDDPEAFRPERFLDPDQEPDRYTYFPFGVGARICLGNMFAMLEAAVILATMVQFVDLEPVGEEAVQLDTLVTLRPRDPLRMRVRLRGGTG